MQISARAIAAAQAAHEPRTVYLTDDYIRHKTTYDMAPVQMGRRPRSRLPAIQAVTLHFAVSTMKMSQSLTFPTKSFAKQCLSSCVSQRNPSSCTTSLTLAPSFGMCENSPCECHYQLYASAFALLQALAFFVERLLGLPQSFRGYECCDSPNVPPPSPELGGRMPSPRQLPRGSRISA